MPGSRYIILVVLLINERKKERKKEREGGKEEGREKEEGEGRKVKKKKINGMRIPWQSSG